MRSRSGFTLIELLAAILIMSIMTIVVGVTFSAVMSGWHRATKLADRMLTADCALNQVAAGLRSAYYPADGNQKDEWGFMLLDGGAGDGEDVRSSDIVEWTKLGNAIIGVKSTMSETSHRVRMWVEEPRDKDDPGGLWVRVWNPDLFVKDDDDRDDEDDFGEEFLLVENVVGFDCKVQKDTKEVESDGQPKWEDEWATSNSIPYRVKMTFRMKPAEKGEDPLPILRVVEIPVWQFSQNPFSLDSSSGETGKKTSSKSGGGGKSNTSTGGRTPQGGNAVRGGGAMPGVGGAPAGGGVGR